MEKEITSLSIGIDSLGKLKNAAFAYLDEENNQHRISLGAKFTSDETTQEFVPAKASPLELLEYEIEQQKIRNVRLDKGQYLYFYRAENILKPVEITNWELFFSEFIKES